MNIYMHVARVYLAEARRRRGQKFAVTLLLWAANARRRAMQEPKQRDLFERGAATTPDLFGGEPDKPRGKHYVEPRGYAAPPWTGPAGETCATCKWAASYVRYAKCRHPLRKFKNTHGKATDIRLRSPACSKWEKETRE